VRGWRGCRDDQPGGFTSSSLDLAPRYQTVRIVNRDRATDESRSVTSAAFIRRPGCADRRRSSVATPTVEGWNRVAMIGNRVPSVGTQG